MTTNVISQLGDKWWPMPPEKFFTAQRAADMWFGDELPPTLQDEMRSPLVTQSKMFLQMQLRQAVQMGEKRRAAEAQQRRFTVARSRVGKRVKANRH